MPLISRIRLATMETLNANISFEDGVPLVDADWEIDSHAFTGVVLN